MRRNTINFSVAQYFCVASCSVNFARILPLCTTTEFCCATLLQVEANSEVYETFTFGIQNSPRGIKNSASDILAEFRLGMKPDK